jgi:dolichyl-phosphate-mannose-protein mannosyltransferase
MRKIMILLFILVLILGSTSTFAENLIVNGDFEEVQDGFPAGWSKDAFIKDSSAMEILSVNGEAPSGNKYIVIDNKKENDTRIVQRFDIEPGSIYKVSYYTKINSITKGSGGGSLTFINGIYYAPYVFDTDNEWVLKEYYIKTHEKGDNYIELWLRFGGFGATVKGKVSYDDLKVEKVSEVPPGAKLESCFINEAKDENDVSANLDKGGKKAIEHKTDPVKVALYILLSLILVSLVLFGEKIMVKAFNRKIDKDEQEETEYVENDQ